MGYGANIEIILLILCEWLMNDLWTRHSYKITLLFHKSALHLVRYEVGKLVTELFSYEECFAL